MQASEENRVELWKKIKDVKIAMLTSVGEDGRLYSRPMYTQQADGDDGLWFFSAKSSAKAEQIARHHEVNVGYGDPQKNLYISVAGRARIVDDPEKERELWNPMNKAFFEGPDDPDLVLLRVDAERAEYWDGPTGKMRQLFNMARSAVTGDHGHAGENEKIELD